MKILATENLKLGIRNAIARLDVDGILWNPTIKPAFDAFNELQPDLVIGTVKDFNDNRAFRKATQEFKTKTILIGNAVRGLRDEESLTNKPLVYNEIYAIDDAIFTPGEPKEKYQSYISFINLTTDGIDDDLIISLCQEIGHYNIRIYGKPVSLLPQWCGHVQEFEKADIIRSSTLNVITPNSDQELRYQILGCNKSPIYLNPDKVLNVGISIENNINVEHKEPTYLQIMKEIMAGTYEQKTISSL